MWDPILEYQHARRFVRDRQRPEQCFWPPRQPCIIPLESGHMCWHQQPDLSSLTWASPAYHNMRTLLSSWQSGRLAAGPARQHRQHWPLYSQPSQCACTALKAVTGLGVAGIHHNMRVLVSPWKSGRPAAGPARQHRKRWRLHSRPGQRTCAMLDLSGRLVWSPRCLTRGTIIGKDSRDHVGRRHNLHTNRSRRG